MMNFIHHFLCDPLDNTTATIVVALVIFIHLIIGIFIWPKKCPKELDAQL